MNRRQVMRDGLVVCRACAGQTCDAEGAAHLRNMTQMQQALTLTDDELAAVTEGAELLQALVEKLTDVPTPGGPTPRQLESPA